MSAKPSVDTVLIAIRAKCLECSGHVRQLVDCCSIKDCALYPYRSKAALGYKDDHAVGLAGQMCMFETINQKKGE